jgi:hypothetical protein
VRVCEEALNITTMAMSNDRRRSSAIDYAQRPGQGSLGRIQSFPGTDGKCTPASGVGWMHIQP